MAIIADATKRVESFRGKRVLVIGDIILDTYIDGTTTRLCREAPVPVVQVKKCLNVPGGAANAAVNLRKMGADTVLVSVTGDDNNGNLLLKTIEETGVKALVAVEAGRVTTTKTRCSADSQLLARFDEGEIKPLMAHTEQELRPVLSELIPRMDAVVLSDYDGCILTEALRDLLVDCHPSLCVVDSRKRLPFFSAINPRFVKPNFAEMCALLGVKALTDTDRVQYSQRVCRQVLQRCQAEIVAITIDRDGAVICDRTGAILRTHSRPVANSRAAGAGDTFLSAFTLSLAAGAGAAEAGRIASAAAAVVVSQEGTVACSLSELVMALSENEKVLTSAHEAGARAAFHRKQGKRVVFTNGCFDIVHAGSIASLKAAKELGDILFVGVNSDESMRRLKGESRPIHALADRVKVVAALSCVDYVIPFDGDTACSLIHAIQPAIYAKGGNYTLDDLPEVPFVKQMGGEVCILPYVGTVSTSGIIDRIRKHVTASALSQKIEKSPIGDGKV